MDKSHAEQRAVQLREEIERHTLHRSSD